MFPEWFQPFEYIDFVSVEGKLQQIWRGSGGDKNSENMLVFRINLNNNFFFFYSSNTPEAGAKLTLPKKKFHNAQGKQKWKSANLGVRHFSATDPLSLL